MKKMWFMIAILVLIIACAPKEVPVVPAEPEPMAEPAKPDTTMQVPAPGYEDVPEMIVREPGEPDDEPGIDIVEPRQPKIEEVREITMIAQKFEFNPSTIEVKQGETVKLTIRSIDVPHGFAIAEYGIRERLDPGQDVHIEFVADKAGEFWYFCSIPCGSGHGNMRGKLIVR